MGGMASLTQVEDTTTHGTKRKAADGLESEQRLAKRFGLLNITDGSGKLCIPVSAIDASQSPAPAPTTSSNNDCMQVEDTKDKVYILDLEKELADAESDEDRPIFIPDIEKHLAKIPKHVLAGQTSLRPNRDNQLVLYNAPFSLTPPKDEDIVRKAITEARDRARERQLAKVPAIPLVDGTESGTRNTQGGSPNTGSSTVGENDPDAMDIE